MTTVGQTKLRCTSLKFIIKVHFLKIYVQYRYLMDKIHSEWSDEFLLSNGNLGAYILAILIDAKILEFQLLSSNTGQGFTKNDLQKRMKAVVCCCFSFFLWGLKNSIVLICWCSELVHHVLWRLSSYCKKLSLLF